MVSVVGRADWGARYAAGFGPRALPTAEAWLHHSVSLAPDLAFRDLDADSVDDDEARAMRSIEAIGERRFGAGFSYNLAVMPSGRAYEGCGVHRIGAHTARHNTRALGVVLVGNYDLVRPPPAMATALVELLRDAHAKGWIARPRFNGGHRDLAATACPGRFAYALLPAINHRAGLPAPATTTSREDDDMTDAQARQLSEVHAMLTALVRPRRPDHTDTDPQHLSLADILTATERADTP